MSVFPEAEARLYKNVYICKQCERKVKVPVNKILANKGVCRKCSSNNLRPVRKKSKK